MNVKCKCHRIGKCLRKTLLNDSQTSLGNSKHVLLRLRVIALSINILPSRPIASGDTFLEKFFSFKFIFKHKTLFDSSRNSRGMNSGLMRQFIVVSLWISFWSLVFIRWNEKIPNGIEIRWPMGNQWKNLSNSHNLRLPIIFASGWSKDNDCSSRIHWL